MRALLAVLLLLTGCTASAESRVLTVFAAASLTETFTELERRFEADNPGVDVRLNFASSSALAQQIAQGARVDVFASADEKNMAKVAAQVSDPRVFATNRLTIVVPSANPAKITSLADLRRDGVTVVVCAPQVPCGAATAKAAPGLRPASEEQDVKAVLTKVVAGEADAGLVYLTDARAAADKVTAIDFAESAQAVNSYPIAVAKDAPEPELARRFADLVTSERARETFAAAGFGKP